jgi:hypothetical protein
MQFNEPVLRLIESRAHHALPSGLTRIAYIGPVSGRTVCLPVLCVADGSRFLVVTGRSEHKRWWRSFRRTTGGTHTCRMPPRRHGTGTDPSGARRCAQPLPALAHPSSGRGIGPTTPVTSLHPVEDLTRRSDSCAEPSRARRHHPMRIRAAEMPSGWDLRPCRNVRPSSTMS